jgi:hypothetical protein
VYRKIIPWKTDIADMFYSIKVLKKKEKEMKKRICLMLVVMVLLLANILPVYAADWGRGPGYSHGPRYSYGASIWIGPGWIDPWWGHPYYSYPYYPYPYYPAPPVVTEQQPSVYVAPAPQQEEQSYWYYCPNAKGYYPYVKKCPEGWLRVVPSPVPQDKGE